MIDIYFRRQHGGLSALSATGFVIQISSPALQLVYQ